MKYSTKIIGLKELREGMEQVAEGVAQGNEYIVIKRSRPLFKIVPAQNFVESNNALEAAKKFAGFLKGRAGPDPLKWQKKIRKEWETIK